MSCSLCGHEDEGRHHLGCARIENPDLPDSVLVAAGLLPAPVEPEAPGEGVVEVLVPGSMTTVVPGGGVTVDQCEVDGCDNPKYSDHPRVKFCAEHKDPKNRKE